MTTKLKTNEEVKNAFDQLFNQLSEQDKLENEANLLMFRFLSIIETKCEELGWNRKQLAEKVGTSASYITQLFRGDKLVNMTTLAKFQNVLGIVFEIAEKKSYEETVKSYSPIGDGKGLWVYHKFGTPNYDTNEDLPELEENQQAEVA
ncbi:MAG: helix-turn-helix transcriptional regulator [Prolixibacteraceae bacterium]